MVKALFRWCRQALAAPFVGWWRRRTLSRSVPTRIVGAVYDALSGDPRAGDRASDMQRQLRCAAFDILMVEAGPGNPVILPLLLAMADEEPSPPKRYLYERKALMLARAHYGRHHPLTIFLEGRKP